MPRTSLMIRLETFASSSCGNGAQSAVMKSVVCTGETYTKVVKLTFAQGASIPDPSRLFNSSLEGNTRRAIDIHEGEKVDARAFKALVKAAVARNGPLATK